MHWRKFHHIWNNKIHLNNWLILFAGKPISPSDVFVVCKITTASFHWKSEFNGGLTQYFHIQFWDKGNNANRKTTENITDTGELTTLQYTLKNLQSNLAYRFRILSTNFYGTSSSNVVECKTDSEGKLCFSLIKTIIQNIVQHIHI